MKKWVLLVFLVQSFLLQAQWKTIFRDDDSLNNIVSASFFSANAGYVATQKWIGYSSDSGNSFQRQFIHYENVDFNQIPVNRDLGFSPQFIQAFNKDTLLVSGDYGFEPSILYSADGGRHWQLVYHRNATASSPLLNNDVYKMTFPQNGSTGFAIQGNEIIKTIDRGRSWQTNFQTSNHSLFTLTFVNALTGYAAGPDMLLKTTDGGASWSVLTGIPYTIQAISATSDQQLFVISSKEDVYYTHYSRNGGASWESAHAFQGGQLPVAVNDLHFINDSSGYACGSAVYRTHNYGRDWELMPGSAPSETGFAGYSKMFFLNHQQAWVAGYSGTLIKSDLQEPRAFLKLNISDSTICTDSLYTLSWTSGGTGALNLLFSTDQGAHYSKLASSLPAGNSSYSFDARKAGVLGKTIFVIEDYSSSLRDSATVQLIQKLKPSVFISASDSNISEASHVIFRAFASNAGSNPGYQWLLNDQNINNKGGRIDLSGLHDNDRVQLILTSSETCSVDSPVSSNVIALKSLPIKNSAFENRGIRLFPNPASSQVTIEQLRPEDQWEAFDIIDINGQQKLTSQSITNQTRVNIPVANLPQGIYFVRLFSKSKPAEHVKFLKL